LTFSPFIFLTLFPEGGPEGKLCAGTSEIRQSGQLLTLKKYKGYFMKRFFLPFHQQEKEKSIWFEDKKKFKWTVT